jgi:3-hydroxybutyryl-CoA dehydrogenase
MVKVHVAIVGAGLMGAGLALVFAAGGHDVTITDPVAHSLDTAKERVAGLLRSLGRLESAVDRITPVVSLADTVRHADLVIEAAPEKVELKQQLFAEIESAAPPHAILASNTSVIPITKVMAKVNDKSRALGTHWWNPPYLIPLVEVVQIAETSQATIETTLNLLKGLGKVPVHVKKDVVGFVGNRMQAALWREAVSLVENGICDAETVDLVVKNSFGLRLPVLGPLENADLVGTDLTLDIHHQVLAGLEDTHAPSPYLSKLVEDGKLGFKTNQGFKTWTEESKADLRAKLMQHLQKVLP